MNGKHRWSALFGTRLSGTQLSGTRLSGIQWYRWLGVVALACGASEVDAPPGNEPPPFASGGTGAMLPTNPPASDMSTAPVGPVGAAGQTGAGTGGSGEGNVTPVGIDG
ncbi:MAG TPA: hypothetical protein VMG12_33430, partial [Polyangiaceae bacterium]|nr:hypothetical protein [Polyangiaceae bacterium]